MNAKQIVTKEHFFMEQLKREGKAELHKRKYDKELSKASEKLQQAGPYFLVITTLAAAMNMNTTAMGSNADHLKTDDKQMKLQRDKMQALEKQNRALSHTQMDQNSAERLKTFQMELNIESRRTSLDVSSSTSQIGSFATSTNVDSKMGSMVVENILANEKTFSTR